MSSTGDSGDSHSKAPNHERWVISYADFMTLLLALFVVLFASSSHDRRRMAEEVKSLIAAFHGASPSTAKLLGGTQGILTHQPSPVPRPTDNPAPHTPRAPVRVHETAPIRLVLPRVRHASQPAPRPVPLSQPSQPPAKADHPSLSPAVSEQLAEESFALERVRQQLEGLLGTLTRDHQVTIDASPLTLTISLDAAVLFDSGQADLLPQAKLLLSHVADSLRSLPPPFSIALQGYTDDRPIDTAQFPSNWSLSAERAVSVVSLFADLGIEGEQLSAEGFGQYAPIADNVTEAGRAKNRRVVIVIRAPDVKAPDGPAIAPVVAPPVTPLAPALPRRRPKPPDSPRRTRVPQSSSAGSKAMPQNARSNRSKAGSVLMRRTPVILAIAILWAAAHQPDSLTAASLAIWGLEMATVALLARGAFAVLEPLLRVLVTLALQTASAQQARKDGA